MVQQRHLRQLMDISWKEHVSKSQVLERAGMPSVEEMITTCQLRGIGHVTRMENSRLPKAVFYGELKEGSRKVGAPRLRSKDAFKRHLKNIDELENWREKGRRSRDLAEGDGWRCRCHQKKKCTVVGGQENAQAGENTYTC